MMKYCGIPFCKNFRGTTDKNVAFFRVPRKNTKLWRVWMINLTTDRDIRKSLENIEELCMLHFKANHLDLEMENGTAIFTLKSGAIPLPLKIQNLKLTHTGQSSGGSQMPIGSDNENSTRADNDKSQAQPASDVKFIDINQLQRIPCDANIKSEVMTDDELQPSTMKRLDESTKCSSCIQLSIQSQNDNKKLQKAKMRIHELEKEVINLKLKIQYLQKVAVPAIGAAVKLEGPSEDVTAAHPDKMIRIVNVADIKLKPSNTNEKKSESPCPKKLQTDVPVEHSKTTELTSQEILCKKCFELFPNVEELVEHLRIVDNHRVLFECFVCKRFTTRSEKIMRKHIERHDRQPKKPVSAKKFRRVCLICRIPLTVTNFGTHLCGDKVDVQCEYCAEKFTATKPLCEHLDAVHKTQRNLYTCAKCPRIFAMVFIRDNHETSHSQNLRPFKCEKCPKKFARQISLSKHIKLHDSHTSILCDECGEAFATKSALYAHKKTSVHSKPKYECQHCPKKFFHQNHLRRHSGVHTGIKYTCEVCSKESTSLEAYKKHKKIHDKTERRYACKHCPMAFYNPSYLRNHERKHLAFKQYHCQHCDQSYTYQSDMLKHLRTHFEDGKIYECTKCQTRFKYKLDLNKHSQEHYEEEKAVGNAHQSAEEKLENNKAEQNEIIN